MTPNVANILAGITLALALAAELWHARRVRRLGRLAFGDAGPPKGWWLSIPARAAGVAAFVWGAATLIAIQPRRVDADVTPADKDLRRLLVVLDVSPSMQLADAGPARDQRRSRRGGDLMIDVLGRIGLGKCKASVVAFYSDAKPVAVDVTDMAVLENIFRDLPLDQAFEPGPSELFKGLASAFALAKEWPPNSTTLVVITDGDVAPATGMPERPAAISDAVVVGVGDPTRASFIAGRGSRQDGPALLQVANRLGGKYFDCNHAPLPASSLQKLAAAAPERNAAARGLRELALAAVAAGAVLVAGVPVGLGLLETVRRRVFKLPPSPPRVSQQPLDRAAA